MEHECDGDTNYYWCIRINPRGLDKLPGRLTNQWTSGDDSDYRIIEICQNTGKSSEDLRRLAVTQTSVKDHQLTLMRKTFEL